MRLVQCVVHSFVFIIASDSSRQWRFINLFTYVLRPTYCITYIHSVSHSVCKQDYCTNNHPISWKLGVMIGSTNQKNWLTFDGDPVPDTDSAYLFYFPYYGGIGNFRRLTFLIQSPAEFHE